jgi:hypothetical protein
MRLDISVFKEQWTTIIQIKYTVYDILFILVAAVGNDIKFLFGL